MIISQHYMCYKILVTIHTFVDVNIFQEASYTDKPKNAVFWMAINSGTEEWDK